MSDESHNQPELQTPTPKLEYSFFHDPASPRARSSVGFGIALAGTLLLTCVTVVVTLSPRRGFAGIIVAPFGLLAVLLGLISLISLLLTVRHPRTVPDRVRWTTILLCIMLIELIWMQNWR